MKLNKAGEPRGNRFARAGDVLGEPGETELPLWGEKHLVELQEFVEQQLYPADPKVFWVLDQLKPGAVSPATRKRATDGYVEVARIPQKSSDMVTAQARASSMVRLRLTDPSLAHQVEQEPDWLNSMGNYVFPRPTIESVLFRPDLEKINTDALVEEIKADRARKFQRALYGLASLRVTDPERFKQVIQITDRQMARELIHQRFSAGDWRNVTAIIFEVLIIYADEVSVSAERGLEIQTKPPVPRPGVALPERKTI